MQTSLFLSQCQTVTAYVSSPYGVDTQTVLQFAGQNQLAVAVVDGGTLLTFVPDLQKETLTQLLASVQASAIGRGLYSSAAQSGNFMVQSAGQNWRCFLQGQAMSTTQWCNILVMQPVTVHSAEVLRLLAVYAAAFMLGWAALILMSAILARFAVRPIEQAQTEQIRFLASASHELKTPLAVISTSADLLKQKSQDLAEPCHLIQQQTRQMGRLIDDMLLLANSDADTLTIKPEACQPDLLLLDTYEKFEPLAKKNGLHLILTLPEEILPDCFCDIHRTEQIFSIIVDNALCYTPSGGKVTLSCHAENEMLCFLFEDTGCGISEEKKSHIFERFYRADDAHTDREHFGLGLCIAKELTEKQNGNIQVVDAPISGCCFMVQLPCVL